MIDNLTDKFMLTFIIFVHVIIVLFFILVPFIGTDCLLFLHFIFLPFILLHWVHNDNSCMLTIIEQALREKISGQPVDTKDCFFGRIIEPIYDFKSNYKQYTVCIYSFTIALWLISASKLIHNYKLGKITSIIQLMSCRNNKLKNFN